MDYSPYSHKGSDMIAGLSMHAHTQQKKNLFIKNSSSRKELSLFRKKLLKYAK